MHATDWVAWHEQYDDPSRSLVGRLAVVRRFVTGFLDSRPDGALQILSLCAGKGLDLLGVLPGHPARERVSARLIELDPTLAEAARATARTERLERVEVVTGDAALTDAYAGAVPADLVLACGVFGNLSDEDIRRTVRALPSLCAEGAVVIWTRDRSSPDLTPSVRAWLADAGFAELAFESPGPGGWAVGMHELTGEPEPLRPGERLFTFTR